MNEWGTPGLPLADLPASKFWPRVTDNLKARRFRSLARGTRSSSQKSSLGWSDEDDDQESGPGNGPGNDRFAHLCDST